MRLLKLISLCGSGLLLSAALGCAHNYYPPPPPPPPPPAVDPLVQFASQNGYTTGRADGERAAVEGRPPDPRRTRAYAETPGFQRGMGPFGVYQNSFRLAYLRGYDHGYRRME